MSVANVVQDRDQLAVSVDEAARLLGVSRDLVYDLVRRGELPAVNAYWRPPARPAPTVTRATTPGRITAAASRSATSRKWRRSAA